MTRYLSFLYLIKYIIVSNLCFVFNIYNSGRKLATPYNMGTIEIGLLWAKITYLKSAVKLFFN